MYVHRSTYRHLVAFKRNRFFLKGGNTTKRHALHREKQRNRNPTKRKGKQIQRQTEGNFLTGHNLKSNNTKVQIQNAKKDTQKEKGKKKREKGKDRQRETS